MTTMPRPRGSGEKMAAKKKSAAKKAAPAPKKAAPKKKAPAAKKAPAKKAAAKKAPARRARAKVWAPLDTSHSPFKRLAKIGPGPRGRDPISVAGKYDCSKGKPKKGETNVSVQVCTILQGKRKGKTVRILTDKGWKKKYNAEYNKGRTTSAPANKYRAGFRLKPNAKLTPAGVKARGGKAAPAKAAPKKAAPKGKKK